MDANELGNAEVMGAEKDSKELSSNAEEVQVVESLGSISSTGNAEDVWVVGSSVSMVSTGSAKGGL